jgi:hypothetical protein
MEQWCVYCQGVYELEESDSAFPTSVCSKECEIGFFKHQKELEEEIKQWETLRAIDSN